MTKQISTIMLKEHERIRELLEKFSEVLSTNSEYSHTFNKAGTFNYHCSIHTSMKAKIVVE